jgi:hypothetical protein
MMHCRKTATIHRRPFKRCFLGTSTTKHLQDDGVSSSGRKKSILSFLNSEVPKPGTLILVRHGMFLFQFSLLFTLSSLTSINM